MLNAMSYCTFKLTLALIFLCGSLAYIDEDNDIYPNQPRIVTENGHLIFVTTGNKNITFRARGTGKIIVNEEDLESILKSAKQSVAQIELIKNNEMVEMRQNIQQLQTQASSYSDMSNRISDIENSVRQQLRTQTNSTQFRGMNTRQNNMNRKINQMKTRLDNLVRLLEKDECESSPCLNGATCHDSYNKVSCSCPPNWEGATCSVDVNECSRYAGTSSGCQNGATCINTNGGFSCICAANWYGVHCTERHDDCSSASNEALCGHGTCINQQRVQQGQPRFICLCDEGWTTDGTRPACTVDVDECASNRRSPCSTNPPVQCINFPGSFTCGSCPHGYSGNGFTCEDINECLLNNGRCSMNPMVQCINTPGSRQCAPCPSGYQGNGESCSFIGICQMNNGGCHPLARCIENLAISSNYRECRCPPNYAGSGVGTTGCIYQGGDSGGTAVISPTGNACNPNPCVRGTCYSSGSTDYHCNCPLGYHGLRCEIDVNECASQPCQNGGTCVDESNGYHCNCANLYSGNHCENIQDNCGGYLSGDNGTLIYPLEQLSQYPHNRSCAWVITTPQIQKILNITFTRINLETSPNCQFDHLQIHDGDSPMAHPIGKFCGTNIPNPILTTHNTVYLWFASDHSVSSDGFVVKWNTIDPLCGGQSNETKEYGTVKSPGYPGRYPLNRDCLWLIKVPLGKKMQLSFATLQLENHDTCNYDYVQIRDGWRENDPILATHCNNVIPPPIHSSSSYVSIYFHSDESHNDMGFLLTYNSIPGIQGCGGTLTGERGSLTSPDHPNRYENGLECDWLIRVHPNERVRLTFTSMEIEFSASNCQWDFVEVFDGPDDRSVSSGRRCGRNIPQPMLSSSNTLFVKFRTDSSVSLPGFRAFYELVCGGIFTSNIGILHSPSYPDPYPASRECIYVIRVEPGKAINLWFEAFDIEGPSCFYDYLEIRDGDTETAPVLGHFCGSDVPEPIISTFNVLWMKFKTDSSIQNRGFLANYTTINLGCGGIYHNQSSGVITSPNHPDEYLHNVSCRWIIRPPPGYLIRITFNTFSLESHWQCNFDYLAIYDNVTSEDPLRRMGKFCGSQMPPTLTSSDNLIYMVFKSDISVARDGFSLSFITFDASSACGGEYFTSMGVIRSPNYPNYYRHGSRCNWVIKVATGKQIRLNVTKFRLEEHIQCNFDYLEIRNGGYLTSPLIGRYCGMSIPRIITSHSNQMWFQFVTDNSLSAPGFEIDWDATLTGCGGELFNSEGSFTSPNYPTSCQSGITCQWRIRVNRGNKIRMVFTDLDTPTTRNCANGIKIYNGPSTRSQLLGSYCGSHIPDPIGSTSNEIFIEYRCPFYVSTQRGFQLSYSTDCNGVLKGRRGAIETPNFPDPYPHNRNCTWTIDAPFGNFINLSFVILRLEPAAECRYDYVQLTNANNRTSIGTYCSAESVPAVISTGTNKLKVNFVSDMSFADNGFSLEWITSGCGEDLKKPSGNFSTPNYPEHYLPGINCEWTIEVDIGHGVELTIVEYDLESGNNCNFDFIKVYSGLDENGILLNTLCEERTSPLIITSVGNHMYVRFKSDHSRSGRGFKATYITRREGCGGLVTAVKGSLHSRNYPNQYPVSEDCSWLLSLPEGHTINLQIADFGIPSRNNCSGGYLAIYDGVNETESNLLARRCDSRSFNISSTLSTVLIRMRGDAAFRGKGFLLNYEIGCGARLVANESINEINTFDVFGTTYKNCSWIISAQNPEDRVSLTITTVETVSSWSCRSNYIEVKEGEFNSSGVIRRFCENHLPPPFISRGNVLKLTLINSVYYRASFLKFKAIYHQTSAFCGGVLESITGTFASPEYPDSYPLNIECVWILRASPGNKISLSFSSFALELSEYCNNDYVEIRENDMGGPLVNRLCGSDTDNLNLSNLTALNQIWIKFRSDGDGTGNGFVATYSIVPNVEWRGKQGEISNPLYPRFIRQSYIMSWTIIVPDFNVIKLTFSQTNFPFLPYGRRCSAGVRIYDGADESAAMLRTYCGSTNPDPLISTTNIVHIILNNPTNFYGSKFLIRWNATVGSDSRENEIPGETPFVNNNNVAGCGGVFYLNESESRTLVSPGYPNGYLNDLKCEWLVTSAPTTHFSLTWNALNVEDRYNCYGDRVEIWTSDPATGYQWTSIGKFCKRDETEKPPIQVWSNNLRIRFLTDGWYNDTGFSLSFTSVCGSNISGPSGVIRSPSFPSNYPPNQNCNWAVSVRPGRTIKFQTNEFELQGDYPSCRNDYLVLRNGYSFDSPFLGAGKYCGTTKPNQFLETTSNHLFVQFYSDSIYSYKGFELRFSETSVECGSILQLSVGESVTIATPNYPSNYPLQSQCEWKVIGPPRRRLKMDFAHLDIPFQSNCRSDYVSIYDGGTAHSRLLGKFCGTALPATMQSSSNMLFIVFSSQDLHPSQGFNSTVTTGECGGTIISEMGTISSPNYPHGYSANLNCEWILRGPVGHYFIFNFIDLQTSTSDVNNCSRGDAVQIRDYNSTGSLLGNFCGWSAAGVIQSADNIVYIRFTSLASSSMSGFLLRFNISADECGGELSNPSGVIVSPNYPGPYPRHRRCFWNIWGPYGHKVRLTFTHFDLELNDRCADSIVALNSLYQEYSIIPPYPMCGTTIPPVITSSSNFMRVGFYSDDSVMGTGFRARYDTDLDWDCGGSLPAESGIVTSPGFGNGSYSHNQYCYWTIDNSNSNITYVIRLHVMELESSYYADCVFDALNIFDGLSQNGLQLLSLCDNISSTLYVLPFSQLYINFHSDLSVAHSGFNLSYEVANCGGIIGELGGTIQSPNYPSNYNNSIHCAWAIRLAEGQKPQITFDDWQLEGSDQCTKDYVLIRNGLSLNSSIIDRYCGSNKPKEITTQSHEALIEFHTDDATVAKGFRIIVTPTSNGCSGIYHSDSGQLSSTSFPNEYPPNIECEWQMEAQSGFFFTASFIQRFDIEMRPNCENDFVEGFDYLNNNWVSLGRRCGREIPPPYVTQSRKFRMVFRSNEATSGNGFRVNWTQSCGGNFNGATAGSFSSPGYPNGYKNSLNCSYLITPPLGHFIVITFDEVFGLEDNADCRFDVIKIYGGNTTSSPELRKVCGSNVPPLLSWKGPVLVTFTTDKSVFRTGFRINYRVSQCGGNLTESSGEITSPTMPDVYHNNMRCKWLIQGDPNKILEIKFQMMDLEGGYRSSCHFDYVAIYNTDTINSTNLIGRYCGTTIPSIVRATTSNMTILFVTDRSVQKNGFRLIYRSTYGVSHGCGGSFNTSSGTISSLDIDRDGQYESGLTCDWTIATDVFQSIQITFTRFDIEKPSDRDICPWDYLELRDGFAPYSQLIGRFCGNALPPVITTSGPRLFIRFVSDESHNKPGFSLNYRSIQPTCGGFINDTGIIQTPNYPENYPIDTRCRWLIQLDTDKDYILNATDFQLESSTGCQKDSMILKADWSNPQFDPGQMHADSFGQYFQFNFKYCGVMTPYFLNIRVPWAIIDFVSDSTVTNKGFRLEIIQASCNQTFTHHFGDYKTRLRVKEAEEGSSKTCVQTIQVAAGWTITFIVSQFYATYAREGGCNRRYLEVRDGANASSTFLGKICGHNSPTPFFSTGNALWIKSYVSLEESEGEAYVDAHGGYYSTDQGRGCGGFFQMTSGEFVSPNYPGSYQFNKVCRWNIVVPINKIVEVYFNNKNFGPADNCTSNYLQIFNGIVEDENELIATVCGGDNARRFTSRTNSMMVKYVTSELNTGPGFKAYFDNKNVDNEEPLVPQLDKPTSSTNET